MKTDTILFYFFSIIASQRNGGLAHQVERQVRNLKAAGSSPVTSTLNQSSLHCKGLDSSRLCPILPI